MLNTETLDGLLESALAESRHRIGQVVISGCSGGFSLCHADDVGRCDLEVFRRPDDATAIALYDDAGNYRPLKSAPNLRHGWRLDVQSPSDLRLALDFLYPAAVGNWRARLRGELVPTPLRATLGRQTGMYRVTAKLTDPQAAELKDSFCQAGCLRRILWTVTAADPENPAEDLPGSIPLLCTEACNLFVAAARKIVKAAGPSPDNSQA